MQEYLKIKLHSGKILRLGIEQDPYGYSTIIAVDSKGQRRWWGKLLYRSGDKQTLCLSVNPKLGLKLDKQGRVKS